MLSDHAMTEVFDSTFDSVVQIDDRLPIENPLGLGNIRAANLWIVGGKRLKFDSDIVSDVLTNIVSKIKDSHLSGIAEVHRKGLV
jgi:hypothetical protein